MMQSFGDSFSDIKSRIKQQMQGEKTKDEALALIKSAYERAFEAQGIVLSRVERERLMRSVMKEVLTDMLEEIDKSLPASDSQT